MNNLSLAILTDCEFIVMEGSRRSTLLKPRTSGYFRHMFQGYGLEFMNCFMLDICVSHYEYRKLGTFGFFYAA